ncbi:MAG: hypothetical protein DCE90_13990 [Pseudanabaena sp.]|nr:MAG: hypothetical protein DCE90_13990 [Pseudanabaena sp.]
MKPTNNNGSIIIRFSKFGYKYSLTDLGRYDDNWAMATARNICAGIETDMKLGRFAAKDNDELFTAYHPLASLSSHHEANSNNQDCLIMVSQKLESKALRDRNLYQTKNFLERYGKPIKSKDDAVKFWNWLQGESKGNNRTINRHLTSLKPICPYFADIPKLKEPAIKADKPFTKLEIKAISDVFSTKYQDYLPFVHFLFATGVRPNEATALKWENVDFEAKTITISEAISLNNVGAKVSKETKTGVIRTIPMSSKVFELLNKVLTGMGYSFYDELVFATPNGKVIDIRNFRARVWVKALNEAKVPYRDLYNIRHTFCSHFLNQTPDFIKLASITHGTKSGVQTLIKHYAHLVSDISMPDMF